MQQSLILLFSLIHLALASKEHICTHGFSLVRNKCLKLFPEQSSFENAKRKCYTHGATLVTIRSEDENRDVIAFSGENNILWIGLYCAKNNLSSCQWDDSMGSAEQFHAFENLTDLSSGCVTINTTSGYWILDDYRTDWNSYVCELPSTVEDDCQHNYNGYCYVPHSEDKSFENAQKRCEAECGSLVSIHSANENRYLNTLAYEFAPHEFMYIGGMWQDFVFRWTDGSRWSYDKFDWFWKREHGQCVVVSGDWEDVHPRDVWYNKPCNETRKYFCKRPANEKCVAGRPEELAPLVSYTCNSTHLRTPGIIESPQSQEKNYCEYQIYTTGFYSIMLTFTTFDIDPKSDELKVYDGDSTESRLIGTFKGHNSGEFSVTSSGSSMFVTYRSNGAGSGKGFEARFETYHYPTPLKNSV